MSIQGLILANILQVPAYLKTFSLVYHASRNMQIFEYSFGEPIRCAVESSKFLSCQRNQTIEGAETIAVTEYIPRSDLLAIDSLGSALPFWTHSLFLVSFFFFFRFLGYCALRRSLWSWWMWWIEKVGTGSPPIYFCIKLVLITTVQTAQKLLPNS